MQLDSFLTLLRGVLFLLAWFITLGKQSMECNMKKVESNIWIALHWTEQTLFMEPRVEKAPICK